MAIANPFVMLDLSLPRASRARTDEWVQSKGSDRDAAPFPRKLDLWWLALCIGVYENRREKVSTEPFFKGSILEPWRIQHLQLLGVCHLGKESISHPADVLGMANEFAAFGIAALERMLEQSENSTILWAVSEWLIKLKDKTGADGAQ